MALVSNPVVAFSQAHRPLDRLVVCVELGKEDGIS